MEDVIKIMTNLHMLQVQFTLIDMHVTLFLDMKGSKLVGIFLEPIILPQIKGNICI